MAKPTKPTPLRGNPPETPPAGTTKRVPVRIGARRSTTERNNSKTIIAAIAVHVVIGFVIVRLVSLGHGLYDWFGLVPQYQTTEEHLVYVEPPKPKPVTPAPKPVVKPTPPVIQLPRVSTGPVVGVPTPIATPVPPTTVGTGGGVDSGGTGTQRGNGFNINPALVGIAPANSDPRVWAPGAAGINVPRTAQQLMDSVVAYAITSAADSLDSIARLYEPGKPAADWTKRLKNGREVGVGSDRIETGKDYRAKRIAGVVARGAATENVG